MPRSFSPRSVDCCVWQSHGVFVARARSVPFYDGPKLTLPKISPAEGFLDTAPYAIMPKFRKRMVIGASRRPGCAERLAPSIPSTGSGTAARQPRLAGYLCKRGPDAKGHRAKQTTSVDYNFRQSTTATVLFEKHAAILSPA